MLFMTTQRWMIAKGAAIASSFALLSPLALANTSCLEDRTAAQPQIAEQLDTFERTAALTRDDLDSYASAARNNRLGLRSHAFNLNEARENVNLLGKQLRELRHRRVLHHAAGELDVVPRLVVAHGSNESVRHQPTLPSQP